MNNQLAAQFGKYRPTRHLSRRHALAGVAAGAIAGMPPLSRTEATARTTPAAQDTGDQTSSFLFVQSAAGGGFAATPAAAEPFTLTLQPVGEHTIYFADHPGREVGLLPTAAFAADVPFDPADPPNAALVLALDAGEQVVVVLELNEPRFVAATHALTYKVAVLTADAWETLPQGVAPLTAEALPTAFRSASLFIDANNTRVAQRFSFR